MSKIFKAPARFDASEVRGLRQEIERLAHSNSDVVIDLARTEHLDGSGVGALVYTFKRLIAGGNSLTIRNVSGQPLNLLNDCGLLRTLSAERRDSFISAALRRVLPQTMYPARVQAPAVQAAANANIAPSVGDMREKGAA
jgi:anti-sigma B factor antagonist